MPDTGSSWLETPAEGQEETRRPTIYLCAAELWPANGLAGVALSIFGKTASGAAYNVAGAARDIAAGRGDTNGALLGEGSVDGFLIGCAGQAIFAFLLDREKKPLCGERPGGLRRRLKALQVDRAVLVIRRPHFFLVTVVSELACGNATVGQ